MRKISLLTLFLAFVFSFEAAAMFPPKIMPVSQESFNPEESSKIFSQEDLPNILKDWSKWVLDGKKKNKCDFAYNDYAQKYCYYISSLDVEINGKNVSFSMNVLTKEKGYIRLPGSVEVFPTSITVNNVEKNIISKAGIPYVYLDKGDFLIKGTAKSKEEIRYLFIPQNVAIVNVIKDGKTIDYVNLGEDGVLKFEAISISKNQSDDLSVFAYRNIKDGIPMMMTLNLNLNVTGKERIENLGKIIPENFALYSIDSDISAYVQKNGDLIVEVKPGQQSINIQMRQKKDSLSLTLDNSPANQEIWVLENDSLLRVIEAPKGAISVQTQNIPMPEAWKRLPAYEVNKGETFDLQAINYGKQEQDNLNLNRTMKLAFDGAFYSVEDRIDGNFKEDGRLSISRPFVFYASKLDGKPQAITFTEENKNSGIEVRKGIASVENVLRIDNQGKKISAGGYDREFSNINWNLNLAPGYKLFHAAGFDSVSGSWVSNWNLLKVFIVALLTVAMFHLFGLRKAVFGFVLLVLLNPLFPEFTYVSFVLCGLLFLQRSIRAENKIYNLLTFLRYSLFAFLSISTFFFIVQHLRGAMYPILDNGYYHPSLLSSGFLIAFYVISLVLYLMYRILINPRRSKIKKFFMVVGLLLVAIFSSSVLGGIYTGLYMIGGSASRMYAPNMDYGHAESDSLMEVAQFKSRAIKSAIAPAMGMGIEQKVENKYQSIDVAKNIAQTGVGFPNWHGDNVITLGMKGPVSTHDYVRIYLLSPVMNFVLAFVRVLLSILLLYWLIDYKKTNPHFSSEGKSFMKKIFSASIVLFALLMPLKANATEGVPSPELLGQLQERLEREKIPSCLPDCVSIPQGKVTNEGNLLMFSFDIHSNEDLVLPLPNLMPDGSGYLKLKNVSINDSPAKNLVKDGNVIYAKLNKGINKVQIDYLLDENSDRFILSSVVRINYMKSKLDGLAISENKSDIQTFQINRTVLKQVEKEKISEKSKMNIEPFFTVKRDFKIGTTWQVETTVIRNNNFSDAVTFEVGLLPSEKLLSAEEILPNNKVRLSFAPTEVQKTFVSLLPVEEDIVLSAPKEGQNFNELWAFDIDYSWSFKFSGMQPVVSPQDNLIFIPRAQETLTLDFFKPNSVDGYILTFDRVNYDLAQGRGSMEVAMNLNFRASDSGVHAILLPKNFEVTEFFVGNLPYPITVNEGKLSIPVVQGQNRVTFKGTLKKEIGSLLSFPKFNLGAPVVNIQQTADVPLSRWVLFVSGPAKGPVVLFWSTVAAWLVFAFVLSRFKMIPLDFIQWFILLIGLTQVNSLYAVIVISWFVVLGLRNSFSEQLSSRKLIQLLIPCLTFIFVFSLFKGIYNGLLGHWNMKIVGDYVQNYGSYIRLGWYQDATMGELPTPRIFSLPVWVYRLVMVVWATWLSINFMKWMKWGFEAYTKDETWTNK